MTDSILFVTLYASCVGFVLACVIFSKTSPRFGVRYIDFLKKHSNNDIFLEYGDELLSAIKLAKKEDDDLKAVVVLGVIKCFLRASIVLFIAHVFHYSQLGELLPYLVERALNGGVHPWEDPFLFKSHVGNSVLERALGFL